MHQDSQALHRPWCGENERNSPAEAGEFQSNIYIAMFMPLGRELG